MGKIHRRARIFLPLFISPSIVALGANKADALLSFNFRQQGSYVELQSSGSLTGLPSVSWSNIGTSPNAIRPSLGELLIGNGIYSNYHFYTITGPANFGTGGFKYFELVSSSNGHLSLQGNNSQFSIDQSYVEGTPITFIGRFANTTLASLGLSSTTTGLLAEYSIGNDSIKVFADPVNVPTPLPWIGATLPFGFGRRLRSRSRRLRS